ncbi:MAG: hypothetical protein NTV62_00960 [Candidatus Gribaldobacteria bacterium]|nr:hypothetical protein [Candidatus Gribaldobacteria bacterium]
MDWEMAVEAIIGRIAQEAERKEIDFITVNEQSMSISNYDYIREAVDRFWLRQGLGTIDVGIPEVKQRGYSSFQGDGSAKVLWKR